jgi:hypothetical protein
MGKGATTECVPRAFRLCFLACLSFYRVFISEYSEGVWKVFFYLFKRYLFLIFLVSSAKVGANHAAKVTHASLTLGVRIRCNRYFLCDV